MLHETLIGSLLLYGSETIIMREKERFRITAVHMKNLRGALESRRRDRVPNARQG